MVSTIILVHSWIKPLEIYGKILTQCYLEGGKHAWDGIEWKAKKPHSQLLITYINTDMKTSSHRWRKWIWMHIFHACRRTNKANAHIISTYTSVYIYHFVFQSQKAKKDNTVDPIFHINILMPSHILHDYLSRWNEMKSTVFIIIPFVLSIPVYIGLLKRHPTRRSASMNLTYYR